MSEGNKAMMTDPDSGTCSYKPMGLNALINALMNALISLWA